ncbi:MAG: hypothetical protein FWF02_10675 [Micrococcales bacterium]|nr:hypothetical protein [Micrococcales bacterium]MCL2668150.1 hypothetical protein [Micrococcales bacterium]
MHGENETGLDGASVPRTGDPEVDAVLADLAGLGDLPLAEQVGLLDDAHQRLQGRLAQSSGAQR